jgi:hypothetical protein
MKPSSSFCILVAALLLMQPVLLKIPPSETTPKQSDKINLLVDYKRLNTDLNLTESPSVGSGDLSYSEDDTVLVDNTKDRNYDWNFVENKNKTEVHPKTPIFMNDREQIDFLEPEKPNPFKSVF